MCFFTPKVQWLLRAQGYFFIFRARILTEFIKLIRSWFLLQDMYVNLWSDLPRVAHSQDQPSPSPSPWTGKVLCPWLCPHWLILPVPKTVRNRWNLNWNFHLKESSEEVLSYSELLRHCYFGLQRVNALLVDTSSAACHTSWQKWTHMMCFVSHDVPHFWSLTGCHGNIWINPIKKKITPFYSHSVHQMCKLTMAFGCQLGFHVLSCPQQCGFPQGHILGSLRALRPVVLSGRLKSRDGWLWSWE